MRFFTIQYLRIITQIDKTYAVKQNNTSWCKIKSKFNFYTSLYSFDLVTIVTSVTRSRFRSAKILDFSNKKLKKRDDSCILRTCVCCELYVDEFECHLEKNFRTRWTIKTFTFKDNFNQTIVYSYKQIRAIFTRVLWNRTLDV